MDLHMVAITLGGIIVLDEPAALYRRHDKTLSGEQRAQTASERIRKAMAVGSDHYAFVAMVAGSSARYLEHISVLSHRPGWNTKLFEAAGGFRRIAQIQTSRSELY